MEAGLPVMKTEIIDARGEVWGEDGTFAEGGVAVAFYYGACVVCDGGAAAHGICEGIVAGGIADLAA